MDIIIWTFYQVFVDFQHSETNCRQFRDDYLKNQYLSVINVNIYPLKKLRWISRRCGIKGAQWHLSEVDGTGKRFYILLYLKLPKLLNRKKCNKYLAVIIGRWHWSSETSTLTIDSRYCLWLIYHQWRIHMSEQWQEQLKELNANVVVISRTGPRGGWLFSSYIDLYTLVFYHVHKLFEVSKPSS